MITEAPVYQLLEAIFGEVPDPKAVDRTTLVHDDDSVTGVTDADGVMLLSVFLNPLDVLMSVIAYNDVPPKVDPDDVAVSIYGTEDDSENYVVLTTNQTVKAMMGDEGTLTLTQAAAKIKMAVRPTEVSDLN